MIIFAAEQLTRRIFKRPNQTRIQLPVNPYQRGLFPFAFCSSFLWAYLRAVVLTQSEISLRNQ
jgi:hypothetical protein